MTDEEIIASSTAAVADLGDKIFLILFEVAPTWFLYAVPLAITVMVINWLFRRRTGRN